MDGRIVNHRYRIDRKIGDGGTAEVYLGFDAVLNRLVALKLLRTQFAHDRTYRLRFEREAQQAAGLSHPNIVAIFDVGEDGGTPYIVMEFVDGHPLSEIIADEAPFHPDDVGILIEQVGSALDFAHERGLVHRDVKPQNVLVDRQGLAKVADFGIAKGLSDATLTGAGLTVGTVHYISPEQASGLIATPESDAYSLAVIAFEMLTGRLPFDGESAVGIAIRHVNEPPADPSGINSDIPTEVADIILRGLDKNPTRRFSSAGEFAKALVQWRSYHPEDWRAARQRATSSGMRIVTPDLLAMPVQAEAPATPVQPTTVARPVTPVATLEPESAVRMAERRRFPWGPIILGVGLIVAAIWFAQPAWDRVRGSPSVDPTPTARAIARQPTAGAQATRRPTIARPTATAMPTPRVVRVPNLSALSESDARGELEALGLELTVTATEPSETAPAGTVLRQTPLTGLSAAPGALIGVVLSSGPLPVDIAGLDVVGLPADVAEGTLRDAGLEVFRVEEGSAEVEEGVVTRVDPADTADRGETITIGVSLGDKVFIPFELQGQSLATVEQALTELGLVVSGTIPVSAHTITVQGIDLATFGIEDGDVVGAQDNGATFGAWVDRGTEVTLVYFDAESAEPTIAPSA